jgi:hypothetical protein
MSKRSTPSPNSADRAAAPDSPLGIVAKGLVEHKVLLYGFGVILVVSTTCQVLRVDFTVYLWIVFAIYLVGSAIWVITRGDLEGRTRPGRASTSGKVVRSRRVGRVGGIKTKGPSRGRKSTHATVIDSEDIGDVGSIETVE